MVNDIVNISTSSITDSLYEKDVFSRWHAWCDLQILASKHDFVLSRRELAKRWKWSRGKVDRFIGYLVEDNRISIREDKSICLNKSEYPRVEIVSSQHIANQIEEMKRIEKDLQHLMSNISQMQSDQSKRETSVETPKKTIKKKEPNPMVVVGRKIFEAHYKMLHDADYYWQAKDAVAMTSLLKKISYSRTQRGMGVSNEEMKIALEAFLSNITDQWMMKNFSVTLIDSKYNEIVAQARAKIATTNGTNHTTKEEREKGAISVIARLAERETGNDNPLRK